MEQMMKQIEELTEQLWLMTATASKLFEMKLEHEQMIQEIITEHKLWTEWNTYAHPNGTLIRRSIVR